MVLKMSFSEVLHGIQSGNDGDLRQGKNPHIFHASGQGTLRDPRECGWVIGSHNCFTGDTVCRLLMKKRGQINIFQ